MNGFKANGTFSPSVVRQGQVMKNTRPAKNVSTTRDFGRFGSVQANRTRWHSFGSLEDYLFNEVPIN